MRLYYHVVAQVIPAYHESVGIKFFCEGGWISSVVNYRAVNYRRHNAAVQLLYGAYD